MQDTYYMKWSEFSCFIYTHLPGSDTVVHMYQHLARNNFARNIELEATAKNDNETF